MRFTCWLGRRLDKSNSEWLIMRLGVIGGTGLVNIDPSQRLKQLGDAAVLRQDVANWSFFSGTTTLQATDAPLTESTIVPTSWR